MATTAVPRSSGAGEGQLCVKRETLQALLEQCQMALELLSDAKVNPEEEDGDAEGLDRDASTSCSPSHEVSELCDLLKSKVESPNFLEKLGSVHISVSPNISDEGASWDMIHSTDLWEDMHINPENESDQGGYVLVNQEDIVEGIACFMAAYLLSLKETKELTPNQLQEALSKTLSVKKTKGKLRRAWDGSKVIYDVASWGVTAIGMYQNPAIYRAASLAFWTSCRVISKLL